MNFGKYARTVAFLWVILGLVACSAKEPGSSSPTMSLDVALSDVHRCSRISPEITVIGAPKDTEYFNIRLVEFGEEDRFLGGGSWPNDGSGIIPEGAMTKHYRGPCPPSGRAKEYAFIVSAMSKGNIQPTVVRVHRFTQE